jgi:Subtilase family
VTSAVRLSRPTSLKQLRSEGDYRITRLIDDGRRRLEMSVVSMLGRRWIGALRTVLASAGALLVLIALPCTSAGAADTVAPLPASDYAVRPVCAAPAPGHAGCLALELVPKTAAALAHTHPLAITRSRPVEAASPTEGAFGLRPQDLHSAYQLPTTATATQTIVIVDAYNDLSVEDDLGVYDETFGLPECTAANGCFTQVNQLGEPANLPFPSSQQAREEEEDTCATGTGTEGETACKEVEEADGWSEEISLDIEVSHAICQHNCNIVLVEADSSSGSNLETAEETAASLGATEISNSWGGPEAPGPPASDAGGPFDRPGIVITASSGDDGYLGWDAEASSEKGFADYPASSPHVVAVGGTRLSLSRNGTWAGEAVWNGDGAGGGGCSVRFTAPPWQQSVSDWSAVGCGTNRAVADVSADADPYTGVAVYNSLFECEYVEDNVVHIVHWCTIGGTSLASPLIAATFALAGGANGVAYPAKTLYENEVKLPGSLHDVVSGSNGECSEPERFDKETGLSTCTTLQQEVACSATAICLARNGYDGPTGVGTPHGILAFRPESEEEKLAEAKLRDEEQHREQEREERQREEKQDEEEQEQGGGSTGNDSTTGASGVSGANGASGDSSPGATASPLTASVIAGQPTIKLSAFALTPSALVALNRARPKLSAVAFAFTLSADARVHATLAKLIRVRGHDQWRLVRSGPTFAAIKGRNRRRLTNSGALTPGRYRLTLTPQNGSARSLIFQIG